MTTLRGLAIIPASVFLLLSCGHDAPSTDTTSVAARHLVIEVV